MHVSVLNVCYLSKIIQSSMLNLQNPQALKIIEIASYDAHTTLTLPPL